MKCNAQGDWFKQTTPFLRFQTAVLFYLKPPTPTTTVETTKMSVRGTLGMSDVYPGIYLGSACVVTPHDLFTRNVKCLVWATPEIDPVPLPEDLRVVRVYVKDEEQQQISHYFPSVAQAYRKCLDADCSMCVVCRAGISRSATLVLAALMTCSDLSLREAYTIVKAARPIIRPNHGFFKQVPSQQTQHQHLPQPHQTPQHMRQPQQAQPQHLPQPQQTPQHLRQPQQAQPQHLPQPQQTQLQQLQRFQRTQLQQLQRLQELN
ncbi:dual specificity protein phosphatase 14-like isoform X5 [Oratosquilla oratoria]|uniref:dual specificity protein phosphatase 14-like isoform X5 n=1 Tax=Oratosquilla oratoria TaxID=337810 RepID=UPI003F76877C